MHKQPKQINITLAILGALALMSNSVAMAGNVTLTNTFTPGQAATASTVNQNFTDVKTAVDNNNGRITSNTSAGNTNAIDIGTNDTDISTNATDIGTNATDIGTNATNIGTNTTAVGTNTTNVGTNTTNIGTNTTGIGTNVTDIGTNATDIGTNTTDISTNATDVGTNATDISTNSSDISTNTSDIADHETRVTSLEGGGGGSGAVDASPVTVNCPDAGAIQTAIDDAEPHGRLVITINGACTDNVVINRRKVTIIGGTGVGTDSIIGATTSPTISSTSKSGLRIENITIGGGTDAVRIYAGAKLKLTNSTIGDGTTTEGGLVVAMGSIARIYGGAGGTIINGGSTDDESPGISAVSNATIQFVSGTVTVNEGLNSSSIVCELSGSVVVGDFSNTPTVAFNGFVDFVENCYLGMFNGTITGDVEFSNNSTLTAEAYTEDSAAVTITGNVRIDSSSSALIDGDTVSIVGDVIIARSSVMSLREEASVTGNVQVRAGSGLDIQGSSAGVISGVLECDTYSGNYLDIYPQSLDVAGSYLVDGGTPSSSAFACSFLYP